MEIQDYKSKYDNYDIGQRLADLKNIVGAQFDSTTPDDPYMRRMYNGLLLAWHIIREPYGSEVPYMEKPDTSHQGNNKWE